MTLRALSGPRLPPARGEATHLVVLVHGYGADGNDLIGLAPHWQQLLPTVAFAAPNAPEDSFRRAMSIHNSARLGAIRTMRLAISSARPRSPCASHRNPSAR